MAHAKRSRHLDHAENEGLNVDSATIGSASARKRPRLSPPASHDVSSEEASDHERFITEASQFATQQKANTPLQNKEAENGIIQTITCTNFMCHKYLEITLGPLINFIIGRNGSGKSAVLTALTICLGGKASSTNRGQNLKSFIKEGEESAMLSVKIKNEGENAYQQEVYGDYIVVERHFSRSGASIFKIKNSQNRIVSNRRADLEDICDYFALQIDNPMNVLTQDMARQFLNTSSPQEKYKFFMKGTQLEHLDCDYLIVEQSLDCIDVELGKKQQDLEVFCEQARKAKRLYDMSSQQDVLQDKLNQLRQQMIWVQVERQEDLLNAQGRKLKELDAALAQQEGEAAGLCEAFNQTEQQVTNANTTVERAVDSLKPLQDERASLKEEHEQRRMEQASLQTDHRGIVSELREAKRRAKNLENDIKKEQHRLSEADGGKGVERRVDFEARQSQAAQASQRRDQLEDEMPPLYKREQVAKKALADFKKSHDDQSQVVKDLERKANSLRQDRGQQMNAYPPNMPRLLKSIQQDSTFRKKPVGPIGSHVRLLEPAWSSILEKQFGGALDSFVVTNKDDQSRLSSLMQQCGCTCPILISNEARLDTNGHEPDPSLVTWLRVLEIDNDLARNSLIINQGIDQTILVEGRAEALRLMQGDRLSNVKQCFTHNQRMGTGLRYGYGVAGALSQSFIPAFKGTPRMKTDIEYQINAQNCLVQESRRELQNIEQQLRAQETAVVNCSNEIKNQKRAIQEARIEAQRKQSSVEELQDALDQDAVEEGRLEALKRQTTEAQTDIAAHERAYEEAITQKDSIAQLLEGVEGKLSVLDGSIDEANAVLNAARSKLEQRTNQRVEALRRKNSAIDSMDKSKHDKSDQMQKRSEQEAVVADCLEQASKICNRVAVEDGDTAESLNRKYDKLARDLDRSKQQLGDRQEIIRKFERARNVQVQASREVEGTERLAQLLKQTLVNRKERWRQFQKLITGRARLQFFYLLSERGFRGRLKTNHRDKTLDLSVEPDETRKSGNGRSTHGLSGGEKSFSTICLLLSIWEAMGAPIRCLDEFDVFMDSVNREVSMKMMVQFARNSPGKQFVLISPQETSKAVFGPDVKVRKMAPPERGQQTLVV